MNRLRHVVDGIGTASPHGGQERGGSGGQGGFHQIRSSGFGDGEYGVVSSQGKLRRDTARGVRLRGVSSDHLQSSRERGRVGGL